jgi:molybdenum cofactor cytidylyltransferase
MHSVLLFASARDLAGSPTVMVELPETATVADLRNALQLQVPALAEVLAKCRLAVNMEFAEDDRTILDGDELAVIPPVSGG